MTRAGKITRVIFIAAETVAALLFMLPMTRNIIGIGNVFGLAVMLACLIATVFFSRFKAELKSLWKKKSGKILLVLSGTVLGILVLYAIILSGMMLSAILNRPGSPDAVIVLGCKVQPSGNPSLMLSKRIDAAYEYLSENEDVICVVSGGKGEDEPESEAAVMKRRLVEMGISPDRIISEDKSTSTAENLAYSAVLLSENGIKAENIAIVTDGFHQLRASLMAKDMGISASAVNAQTPFWLFPTYWVREWFGLSYFFVFGTDL